jgi:hypothetical protein
LVVVIGKHCKHVTRQETLAYVAGYMICNDVSAHDLQLQRSQWTAGKAIDTFAPMGPGIVPTADLPDPQALTLTMRVNGEVVQREKHLTDAFLCGRDYCLSQFLHNTGTGRFDSDRHAIRDWYQTPATAVLAGR